MDKAKSSSMQVLVNRRLPATAAAATKATATTPVGNMDIDEFINSIPIDTCWGDGLGSGAGSVEAACYCGVYEYVSCRGCDCGYNSDSGNCSGKGDGSGYGTGQGYGDGSGN